jgi:hypothetical protein
MDSRMAVKVWGASGKRPAVGTFTGRLFNFLDPRIDEVDLLDIAHGLSNLCRFNGQSNEFYSVAQHSVCVSHLCNTPDARWGLLHDAAEAYLGDIVSPVKHNIPGMENFSLIEDVVMNAIAARFGLGVSQPQSVFLADRLAVLLELDAVINTSPHEYGYVVERWDLSGVNYQIVPVGPAEAKAMFLERAEELGIR